MRFYFPTHEQKEMERRIFPRHQSTNPLSWWCSQQHYSHSPRRGMRSSLAIMAHPGHFSLSKGGLLGQSLLLAGGPVAGLLALLGLHGGDDHGAFLLHGLGGPTTSGAELWA